MKKYYLRFIHVFLFFSIFNSLCAQETVVFSTNNLYDGVIEKGFAGLNSSFLLDSDIERPRTVSNEDRWAEMQVGAVRFPYGALADNYLWDDDGDWGNTLTPKIASTSKPPGNFPWAINTDGTFKKAMNFDEFMEICQRKNIKPLIVINILSHKYTNGPTYAKLKETAVEWVKYAKLKNYNVAYWQIGNEVDHNHNKAILTQAEYVQLYIDFAGAMKAADPTIKCGPGLIDNVNYYNNIVDGSFTDTSVNPNVTYNGINTIDFTSAHQYLFQWEGNETFSDYDEWLAHNGRDLNPFVRKMQNAVNNRGLNTPILITETNAFGGWQYKWPAMYKGLAVFDMLLTQQQHKNVSYAFVWNTHSVWGTDANGVYDDTVDEGIANVLYNGPDNEITAMGMPVKILNSTAEERIMIPDSKVSGKTYSYGTHSASTGKTTIYLINKATTAVNMNVTINNYEMPNSYERWVWSGDPDLDSRFTTYTQTGNITKTSNGFTTDIPPSSLVVVKLNPVNYYLQNIGKTDLLKSNSNAQGDVFGTPSTDTDVLARWTLLNQGNGYFIIHNYSNGKTLQAVSNTLSDETAVNLASSSEDGDAVQWKFTEIEGNWYIDNKLLPDRRLSITSSGAIILGATNWNGNWTRWSRTEIPVISNNIPLLQVAGAQTIASNTTTNIEVASTGDLTIPDGVTVTGNITLASNGNVTIESTGAVEGNILINNNSRLTLGSGKINGNITMVDGGSILPNNATFGGTITYTRNLPSNNWHLISSPVVGENLSNLISNTSPLADGGTHVNGGTETNIGLSQYSNTTENWTYFSSEYNGTDEMIPGIGYGIKLATSGGQVVFSGGFNNSDALIPVAENTNGFNLIGNPYLSYVSVIEILDTNSSILKENTVWVWDQSINGGSGGFAPKSYSEDLEIAPGQGFFVEVDENISDNISITQLMQSHKNDTFKKEEQKINISVAVNNGEKSTTTSIYYLDGTTTGFDNGYDSSLFGGIASDFVLYTKTVAADSDKKLGIQSLPIEAMESVISLGLKAEEGSTLEFSVKKLNFADDIFVYLEDKVTQKFTRIDNTTFNTIITTSIDGVGRFFLHVTNSILSTENEVFEAINIYVNKNVLKIEGIKQGESSISLYNVLGKKILETSITAKGNNQIVLPNISKGLYIVEITNSQNSITKKLIIE